jgi:hypothetical protein
MGTKARRYRKILRKGYRPISYLYTLIKAKKDNVNTTTVLGSGKIKDE